MRFDRNNQRTKLDNKINEHSRILLTVDTFRLVLATVQFRVFLPEKNIENGLSWIFAKIYIFSVPLLLLGPDTFLVVYKIICEFLKTTPMFVAECLSEEDFGAETNLCRTRHCRRRGLVCGWPKKFFLPPTFSTTLIWLIDTRLHATFVKRHKKYTRGYRDHVFADDIGGQQNTSHFTPELTKHAPRGIWNVCTRTEK